MKIVWILLVSMVFVYANTNNQITVLKTKFLSNGYDAQILCVDGYKLFIVMRNGSPASVTQLKDKNDKPIQCKNKK